MTRAARTACRRFPPARRSSTARSIWWPRSARASSSWRTKTPRSGSSGPGYICETSRMRMCTKLCGFDAVASPTREVFRVRLSGRRAGSCSLSPACQLVRSALGVVGAELVSQHLADLADRAAHSQRLAHRVEQVALSAGDAPHLRERALGLGRPALRAHMRRPLVLAALGLGVDREQLDVLLLSLRELVDSDDHALARLDLCRVAVRRLLDLPLDEALLDRGHRAAQLVDPLDQLHRARLELVGHRLDEERPAQRIGRVGAAGLVLEDLLGAQRNPRRPLGWQ